MMAIRTLAEHDVDSDSLATAAGIATIAAPLITAIGVVLAANEVAGYSHVDNYMSELGAQGSAGHQWFLWSHLAVTFAMLIMISGIGRIVPWSRLASRLFVTATICTAGIALVRCSPGCPDIGSAEAGWSDVVHTGFALVDLAAVTALPFAVALGGFGPGWRPLRRISAVVALVLLGVAVALLVVVAFDGPRGLLQRMFFVVAWLWFAVCLGGPLLSRHIRGRLGAHDLEPSQSPFRELAAKIRRPPSRPTVPELAA